MSEFENEKNMQNRKMKARWSKDSVEDFCKFIETDYRYDKFKKAWIAFFDPNIDFEDEVKYIKAGCSDMLSRFAIDIQEERESVEINLVYC